MWSLKKIWYTIYQAVFNIAAYLLPWRKPAVVSGAGSIGQIPALLRQDGVTKPLVVTDPGLMKVGIAPRIVAVLTGAAVPHVVYAEVEPNPSVDTVNAIQKTYLDNGCDGFIAIGGGSAMDAAKAAGARVVRPNKSVGQLGGLLHVLHKLPPLLAVPTTAGTGSETTVAALITDNATHHKYAIMDLALIPRRAVLDPELTVGLPPHITSTTGMDALTHAVEAYLCWTMGTAESIRFAEEAVALIFQNLEKVYAQPADIEGRANMLLASFKAGFAFTRAGVGNVHAIAHTLGGLYNTPHGLANAVILPVVLRDYGAAVQPKLAHLATIAGLSGTTEAGRAEAFIAAIEAMNARMDIPKSFDFILDKDIPQMIQWALKEANPTYPVPVYYNAGRFRAVIEKIRTEKQGERVE